MGKRGPTPKPPDLVDDLLDGEMCVCNCGHAWEDHVNRGGQPNPKCHACECKAYVPNAGHWETKEDKLKRIIATAKHRRVANNLVLCENCDNPASLSLSLELSWTACAPCVWGEADSLDAADLIAVESSK